MNKEGGIFWNLRLLQLLTEYINFTLNSTLWSWIVLNVSLVQIYLGLFDFMLFFVAILVVSVIVWAYTITNVLLNQHLFWICTCDEVPFIWSTVALIAVREWFSSNFSKIILKRLLIVNLLIWKFIQDRS